MERRKFLQYASAGSLGALTANGAPTTVHTGILGTQHSHTTGKLQAMKASPDYEVVAICESDPAVRERAQKTFDFRASDG